MLKKRNVISVASATGREPAMIDPDAVEGDDGSFYTDEPEEDKKIRKQIVCGGCLGSLKRKEVDTYYEFDKYTIYICVKCWKKLGTADRIRLYREMREDTQYSE